MFLLCALPSWETERNALARCSACSRSSGAAWPSTDARSMHKMKMSLFIIICDHRCHGFFFNVTDVFSPQIFLPRCSPSPFGEGRGGAPGWGSVAVPPPLLGRAGVGLQFLPRCSPSPFGEGWGGAPGWGSGVGLPTPPFLPAIPRAASAPPRQTPWAAC